MAKCEQITGLVMDKLGGRPLAVKVWLSAKVRSCRKKNHAKNTKNNEKSTNKG